MSGFYIGVDGKARKVKGGYIGIDGKARKIKKGYIGDASGVARLCWSDVDPVFANNTWEEIAVACQNGNVPTSWAVGDQKTMTIDGVEYAIDIIGKNHDDYSDGSGKAPLTFQLHECYSTQYQMNYNYDNTTGWETSAMRRNNLTSVFLKMPVEVQAAIREVNKTTSIGGGYTGLGTTADKLFLLSEIEIFGDVTWSLSGEGEQYEYYSKGGSNRRIKKVSNTNTAWWQRSPSKSNTHFCHVDYDGSKSSHTASNFYGVSFAFCF